MTIDLFALTAELVSVPSVSFHESALVDRLESDLRAAAHLEVTRVGDNLVARTELGRSSRVILAGHTDTVPPDGNAEPRIDGDTLWGCGAADMKGGLAVMLALAAGVTEPAVDVTYVFYAREEVAVEHNGLRELYREVPELLVGDVAVLGEPTSTQVEAGCQGTLRVEITLRGARAHTARPWMGRNAIHRLGDLLAAVTAFEPRHPTVDGCEYREALQAVAVNGGVAGNVVPDEARVTLNHRFAPDRSAEEAVEVVRAVVGPVLEPDDGFVVTDLSGAARPGLDHPLFAKMIERGQLSVSAKLGWTDVAFFSEHGVPAVNLGPGDSVLAHTAEERVDRAAIEAAHRALEALLTGG